MKIVDVDEQAVVAAYTQGMSIMRIARDKRFSVSTTKIRNVLKKHEIKRRRPGRYPRNG